MKSPLFIVIDEQHPYATHGKMSDEYTQSASRTLSWSYPLPILYASSLCVLKASFTIYKASAKLMHAIVRYQIIQT